MKTATSNSVWFTYYLRKAASEDLLLSKRIWVGSATAFTLLALLVIFMPLHTGTTTGVASAMILQPALIKPMPVVHPKMLKAAAPAVVEQNWDMRNMGLHAIGQMHTCLFQGVVLCGDHVCHEATAKIRIYADSDNPIEKDIALQPDGSYSLAVSLTTSADAVDWEIVASSPESTRKVLQGRAILEDDSNVNYVAPISLL